VITCESTAVLCISLQLTPCPYWMRKQRDRGVLCAEETHPWLPQGWAGGEEELGVSLWQLSCPLGLCFAGGPQAPTHLGLTD
jgi:hypothetical protein